MQILLSILFLCHVAFGDVSTEHNLMWNETWTDRLKRDLFVRYDKFSRPTQHYNKTLVQMDIEIHHVFTDEFRSTITVTSWVKSSWTDEKLKWDISKYGGVDHMSVGNHEVWLPDIVLYNSATANTIEHYGDTPCVVYSNGMVLWVPPSHFVALCNFDLRLWPFDTQVCSLKLGSWTYHGEQIDLELQPEPTEQDPFIKNAEWKLVKLDRSRHSVKYPCCKEEYVDVEFELTLKRNSVQYYNILLTPAIAVIFLILAIFWLPTQSEMRVTIAACTALIISLFLMYFGMKVPMTTNPPLIVYFYSGCLCQTIVSLIISVLVINMSRRCYCKPLPRNIRVFLLSWPGKILGLSDLIAAIESRKPITSQELRGKLTEESTTNSTSNISDDGDKQNIISPAKNTTQLEWLLAATAIDRAAFILFCIILCSLAIVCIS